MNDLHTVPLLDALKMVLKSQASQAIVPAASCSSDPGQGLAAHCADISMQAKETDEHDQEQLSGFIFMCNGRTKAQCYMYRVFGLPVGKLEVVEKIKPGMKLFLFDFELKLLYGIYEATSAGTLHLQQSAFNGRFPAQVGFKIYRDCLPMHESSFRHAIEYNYQKGFKFKQELNKQQVTSLVSLFCPLTTPPPASLWPMLLQGLQNQSGLPFPKDSCAQVLESQQFQQIAHHQQSMGHVHPVEPNVTGLQLSYVQPVSEPQNILQSVPSPQENYFGSTKNMGHYHPTVATAQNQSGLRFPKDSRAQVLEFQQVQQIGLQQGIGHVRTLDPNVTGLQLSYVQPVSESQNILQRVPSLQEHYFRSTRNIGHSHPNMTAEVLLTPNYQYYLADIQQPYAAGNPTHTLPGQFNSNEEYVNQQLGMGNQHVNHAHQRLGMGNMYQLPLQREGETVQQQESLIQYHNSCPSAAASHVTTSVLSDMPTMVSEAANWTLPLAQLYPFAGAASTYHSLAK